MSVLSCTEAFAYSEPNGVQRVLRPGDVVDEHDPCVTGRESYFEPVEATVHRATERAAGGPVEGVIEQATRAPGEKRPRRSRAKKADDTESTDEPAPEVEDTADEA